MPAQKKVNLKLEAPGNGKALSGPEGDAAAAELGMARISNSLLNQMSELGVNIERAGIVHTDRGFAFGTKEAIWECVQEIKSQIKGSKYDVLCEIASALSKCAKGIGLLSGKNIGGVDAPTPPDAPRRSFAPGQRVEFHSHQHVHVEKPA